MQLSPLLHANPARNLLAGLSAKALQSQPGLSSHIEIFVKAVTIFKPPSLDLVLVSE